ncbi:immunity 49 family protein [Streptomyces nigra]|uniref:immunity 49 family protein n=1 Tax=Streptomyces nigra TaxID=1827580 RepID=UPI0036A40C65
MLTTEKQVYEEAWEPTQPATTARTWITAFTWCVASGLVWDWERVIGLLPRENYAPEIRDGVPYSKRESTSDPADIAEMDALCVYLTQASGHLPMHWPKVPLCKPNPEVRASAARELDHAGALTPDQRLLRVLLDDDQATFEQALQQRLVEHRETVGAHPARRTLSPVNAVALAVLASRVHGWQLGIRTAYLPESLLHASGELSTPDRPCPETLGRNRYCPRNGSTRPVLESRAIRSRAFGYGRGRRQGLRLRPWPVALTGHGLRCAGGGPTTRRCKAGCCR